MKPVGNASVMRKSKKMHKTSGMNPTLIVHGKISLFLVGPNGVIFSKKIVKNQMAPYQRDTAASRFVDHDSMSVLWQLSFFPHIMKSVVMTHHAQFSDECVFWWACNFLLKHMLPGLILIFSGILESFRLKTKTRPQHGQNIQLQIWNHAPNVMLFTTKPFLKSNLPWKNLCEDIQSTVPCWKKKVISTKYTLHSMQLKVLSHNSRHGPPPNLTTFSTPHTFIFPSLEVGHGNKNLDKWTKQDRHNLKSTVTCIRYKVSENLHWNLDETIKLRLTPFFLFRFFLIFFDSV